MLSFRFSGFWHRGFLEGSLFDVFWASGSRWLAGWLVAVDVVAVVVFVPSILASPPPPVRAGDVVVASSV